VGLELIAKSVRAGTHSESRSERVPDSNDDARTITRDVVDEADAVPAEVAQLKDLGEDQLHVLRAENGSVGHEGRLTRRVEDVMDDLQHPQILPLRRQELTSYAGSTVDLHCSKLTFHTFSHCCVSVCMSASISQKPQPLIH